MVIGLRDESSHVYAAPCYACPQLSFDVRPHYLEEDLIIFDVGYDERRKIDTAIAHLKDLLVRAEVHRYRSASSELDHLEQLLINLEAKWGELAAQKLGAIRRLEMANAMARIEEVQRDEVDMCYDIRTYFISFCLFNQLYYYCSHMTDTFLFAYLFLFTSDSF